jgi:septum formation protein
MRLVLASASPRRAELLRAAGFEFDIITADVDESLLHGEAAAAYVERLAESKARIVAPRAASRPILGADTVVLCGDEILGKPTDSDDAKRILRMLSGRWHQVMTGVCLLYQPAEDGPPGSRAGAGFDRLSGVASTAVEFVPLTAAEIDWYVSSEEPSDKAGAYAIQGLASRFITRIDGSYSNVVGLPVALVYDLCKQAGILIS